MAFQSLLVIYRPDLITQFLEFPDNKFFIKGVDLPNHLLGVQMFRDVLASVLEDGGSCGQLVVEICEGVCDHVCGDGWSVLEIHCFV